jgi:hypothetical protein
MNKNIEMSNDNAEASTHIEVPNYFIDEAMSGLSGKALVSYLAILRRSDIFQGGKFCAWTSELMRITGISDPRSVGSAINELIGAGLIERTRINDQEAYEYLKKGEFKYGCYFCGYNRSPLDAHHYPVRAKDGGAETINICANCHREFHQLTDCGYFKIKSSK